MLALLLTGLATVALVGGLTFVRVSHKVDLIRREQAAADFHASITDYLAPYGSWQAANAAEPFDLFMRRQHSLKASIASNPTGLGDLPVRPPQPPGPPGDAADPRGGFGPQGGPPAPGRRPPPPPGEAGGARGEPPFHFVLTDQNFAVLLGAGAYRHGEALPLAERKDAQPVLVDQRIAAYVLPQGVLTPSRQEQDYMAALREALLVGAASAALLALGLGLLLSSGLSRTLSRLTQAVRAMHGGSLLQQVPVSGKDEVATLAKAFNQMSEQLARSHEELHATHQTIVQQAEQLKELSVRDALTGLYNRRHFDAQADIMFRQAVRHGRPVSMVIGDVDFFKRVNDSFSHAVGDAVLRQVSAILLSHMRATDLVARYGGEEFVIAFPETALEQAAALCDKLRDMIERFPWHELHPGLAVTMSMGVCGDMAAGSTEAMLQQADAHLYRAKQDGRNRVCFA